MRESERTQKIVGKKDKDRISEKEGTKDEEFP